MEQHREKYIYLFDKQQSLYANYARQHSLQGKSQQILMWLYYHPKGMTQKRLVEVTYSTKQVVHAAIKRMTLLGYIKTCEVEGDKRHKLLCLTEEGNHFAAEILEPLRTIEVAAMEALTEEEQAQYVRLTQKYTQALSEKMEEVFSHD